MTGYRLIILFCIVLVLRTSGSQDKNCKKNKCYGSVEKSYNSLVGLINRFNKTSAGALVPKIYDFGKLTEITNVLKEIDEETKNQQASINNVTNRIKEIRKNNKNDELIIQRMADKLNNISSVNTTDKEFNNTLDEIENRYAEANLILARRENAYRKCEAGKSSYNDFRDLIATLSNNSFLLTDNYNKTVERVQKINLEVGKTSKDTLNIKTAIDQLTIPSSTVGSFTMEVENKLNHSIDFLKINANILQLLLNDTRSEINARILREEEMVTKKILELQESLEIMKKSLEKYKYAILTEFTPSINEETVLLSNEISEKITSLESKIKSLGFTDEEKALLNTTMNATATSIMKKRLNVSRLGQILDYIANLNLKKISKELQNLKLSIYLIEKSQELEDELKHLRRWRDEILELNCTQSIDGVLT